MHKNQKILIIQSVLTDQQKIPVMVFKNRKIIKQILLL